MACPTLTKTIIDQINECGPPLGDELFEKGEGEDCYWAIVSVSDLLPKELIEKITGGTQREGGAEISFIPLLTDGVCIVYRYRKTAIENIPDDMHEVKPIPKEVVDHFINIGKEVPGFPIAFEIR